MLVNACKVLHLPTANTLEPNILAGHRKVRGLTLDRCTTPYGALSRAVCRRARWFHFLSSAAAYESAGRPVVAKWEA